MIIITESDRPQTTLGQAVELEGFSANSFKDCQADLLPAPADTGIVFQTKRGKVKAIAANLDSSEKRHTTTLRQGRAQVKTVEHLMSAFYGLGIDNAIVRMRPCGIPHKDFAGGYFADRLKEAGTEELTAKRKLAVISKEVRLNGDPSGRYLRLIPGLTDKLEVSLKIDFPEPVGQSSVEYDSAATDYAKEVAWARSFIGSPVNGDADKWDRIRKAFPILPEDPAESPLITYDDRSFLTPLRQPDEPARHKLLDFLGDLYLLGYRLAGQVEVYKPGHRFTTEVVRRLAESLSQAA